VSRGTFALPWFMGGYYARTRDLMADRDQLPEAYDVWLMSARQIEGELKRVGYEITRVMIEPQAFLAWCKEQRMTPDGQARTAYAKAMAMGVSSS
jgi:hypothetical protein